MERAGLGSDGECRFTGEHLAVAPRDDRARQNVTGKGCWILEHLMDTEQTSQRISEESLLRGINLETGGDERLDVLFDEPQERVTASGLRDARCSQRQECRLKWPRRQVFPATAANFIPVIGGITDTDHDCRLHVPIVS